MVTRNCRMPCSQGLPAVAHGSFPPIADSSRSAITTVVRYLAAFILVAVLGGCQFSSTRPDQDNFTIHAGPSGIQPFIALSTLRITPRIRRASIA